MYKMNVGNLDRVLRVSIGLALLALVFSGPKTTWGWLGLPLLLTGMGGWCALYYVLGIDTRRAPVAK